MGIKAHWVNLSQNLDIKNSDYLDYFIFSGANLRFSGDPTSRVKFCDPPPGVGVIYWWSKCVNAVHDKPVGLIC